jgi:hypothetical protein
MNIVPRRAQPLPDLSGAPRTRLLTSWGTVLYVEPASGELRHGPRETSPADTVFITDPAAQDLGWIMVERKGRLEPVACGPQASWIESRAETSASPIRLELRRLRLNLLCLTADGLYLSAEADGRVTLSRLACAKWEEFSPLEGSKLAPRAMEEPLPLPSRQESRRCAVRRGARGS